MPHGLDALTPETVITSLEDLLSKVGFDEVNDLDAHLSARMDCEFAVVEPDEVEAFMVVVHEAGIGLGQPYPFTIADLDKLLDDIDVMYHQWWFECDDLAALCAEAGDGTVPALEAAMTEWACAPVTVSRRATKRLVATGPGGRVMLAYPVTVHQVREAAYDLSRPAPAAQPPPQDEGKLPRRPGNNRLRRAYLVNRMRSE